VSDRPLRVGRIAYTNVAPVETAFDAGAVTRDAVVTSAAPNVLNAMLSAGELDISPVSAAHYLRHEDRLALCGDTAIIARGRVISVLLVSSRPPALLDDVSVAVTSDSASGRALLECLLRGRYGVRASFESVDRPTAEALTGRPTLLIGDAAVAIYGQVPPQTIYDLGTAWFAWTGLPMVYAVWAVRREVLLARSDDVQRLIAAYTEARTWGNAHRDAVVDAAIAQRARSRAFYESYYETLRYRLDADARKGLARFKSELIHLEISHAPR
jgi:chorismate dehydratase